MTLTTAVHGDDKGQGRGWKTTQKAAAIIYDAGWRGSSGNVSILRCGVCSEGRAECTGRLARTCHRKVGERVPETGRMDFPKSRLWRAEKSISYSSINLQTLSDLLVEMPRTLDTSLRFGGGRAELEMQKQKLSMCKMEMLFKILTKLVWSEYESIRTNARLAKRHGRTAPCRHSTGAACAGIGWGLCSHLV